VTAQTVTGIAQPLQGPGVLRRFPSTPQVQGDPEPSIGPHQPHVGDARHRPALLAGEDPRQAPHGGRRAQEPYHAIMRHGFQGVGQGDTRRRRIGIAQGGALEPHRRRPGVPSYVMVGWGL